MQKYIAQLKLGSFNVHVDDKTFALRLLRDSESKAAVVLLMAVISLYGSDILQWEPETLWLTLETSGVSLDVLSRDKLQAAIALIQNPVFFSDSLVFQRTTKALNGEVYDPETLQECHPAHMAWAVSEATIIRGLDPQDDCVPEIDEDVQQYIAVCLKRAGYICAPEPLQVIQQNLTHMLDPTAAKLHSVVVRSWAHLDKTKLGTKVYPETPVGIQLAHLASCYTYTKSRITSMARDILTLQHSI